MSAAFSAAETLVALGLPRALRDAKLGFVASAASSAGTGREGSSTSRLCSAYEARPCSVARVRAYFLCRSTDSIRRHARRHAVKFPNDEFALASGRADSSGRGIREAWQKEKGQADGWTSPWPLPPCGSRRPSEVGNSDGQRRRGASLQPELSSRVDDSVKSDALNFRGAGG